MRPLGATAKCRTNATYSGLTGIVVDRCGALKVCPPLVLRTNITSVVLRRRHDTRQHINIVVRGAARTINRQESIPIQSCGIYRVTKIRSPPKSICGALIKARRLVSICALLERNAERIAKVACATDKNIAVTGHVERPVI